MPNEIIENAFAYQACQSILAGDQKPQLTTPKKHFHRYWMSQKPLV
ncbi:hypothetical protein GO003_025010 [Methylicorpusculum oleiharenae]|nr:hypothetical protein [Methylicorpusculum oleiharenae]MCD2453642.1 hypothetical protein [Methylicorpusculum oleiharenae]